MLHLLGERAWWLPGWLDRVLPHVDVEGESLGRSDEAPEAQDEPERVSVR